MTAPPTTARSFPELDTIRAIAALLVVATHTAFSAGVYGPDWFGSAAQRLELGVALFFVLSGFLLGRPYLRSALTGVPHAPTKDYLRKRALRILPVYWVTVIAAFAVVSSNYDLAPRRWLQSFLLIDYYQARQLPEGLTQMWSLAVEASFYLVLPLIGLALVASAKHTRHPRAFILGSLIGTMVVSATYTYVTHATEASWGFWAARGLPAYLTWFALGMVLAFAEVDRHTETPGRPTRLLVSMAADRLTCLACAGAAFVVVATPVGGLPFLIAPTAAQATTRHLAYASIAFFVVLPSVLGPRAHRTDGWFVHPVLRHLGHLSYSLFCCHVIVLFLSVEYLGFTLFNSSWPLLFAVVLTISLIVSELLYRYVELPFLALKPRSRRTKANTSASA